MERPRLTKKQMLSTQASPAIFERCGFLWLRYRVKEKYWMSRVVTFTPPKRIADLSKDDQGAILRLLQAERPHKEIARIFGVSTLAVSELDLVRRR